LKYLKSRYGLYVGIGENQDLKILQSQHWFYLSTEIHEKQLIYSSHIGHRDITAYLITHNHFSFQKHNLIHTEPSLSHAPKHGRFIE
jgi:hypothetical protein